MSQMKFVPNEEEEQLVNRIAQAVLEKVLMAQESNQGTSKEKQGCPPSSLVEAKQVTGEKAEQFIQDAEQRLYEGTKQRIKKMAEQRQLVTFLDVPIRQGLIDVGIEVDQIKIACFVYRSYWTSLESRALLDGVFGDYDRVLISGYDNKSTETARKVVVPYLASAECGKVVFIMPDRLGGYFDSLIPNDLIREDYIKGRRIRVEFCKLSVEETEQKSNMIKHILAKAPKKRE